MAKSRINTKLTVNIHDTGTKFNMGDTINPTWDDLRIMMRHLWALGYGKTLLPTTVPEETLASGNRVQLETLVPLILQNVENAMVLGKIDIEHEPKLVVICYILAWYWHMQLGGPRPIYDPKRPVRRQKIYGVIPELKCPFCTKAYEPPMRLVHQSAIFKAWHQWLTRHAKEYHKWDMPTKTK